MQGEGQLWDAIDRCGLWSELTDAQVRVIVRLMMIVRHRGRLMWARVGRVADETPCSPATVYKTLSKLKAHGLAEVFKPGDGHSATTYRFILPEVAEKSPRPVLKTPRKSGAFAAHPVSTGREQLSPPGETATTTGVNGVYNTKQTPEGVNGHAAAAGAGRLTPGQIAEGKPSAPLTREQTAVVEKMRRWKYGNEAKRQAVVREIPPSALARMVAQAERNGRPNTRGGYLHSLIAAHRENRLIDANTAQAKKEEAKKAAERTAAIGAARLTAAARATTLSAAILGLGPRRFERFRAELADRVTEISRPKVQRATQAELADHPRAQDLMARWLKLE